MEAEERPSNERSRSRAEPCRARVQNGEGRADHAEAPISSRRCLADCAESADQKAGADAHLLGLLRDVGILERGLLRSARAQRESRRTLRPPATLQSQRSPNKHATYLFGFLSPSDLLALAASPSSWRPPSRTWRECSFDSCEESGISRRGERTSEVLGRRPSEAARVDSIDALVDVGCAVSVDVVEGASTHPCDRRPERDQIAQRSIRRRTTWAADMMIERNGERRAVSECRR